LKMTKHGEHQKNEEEINQHKRDASQNPWLQCLIFSLSKNEFNHKRIKILLIICNWKNQLIHSCQGKLLYRRSRCIKQ
jgi:hypothetical protein